MALDLCQNGLVKILFLKGLSIMSLSWICSLESLQQEQTCNLPHIEEKW